MLIFPTLRRNFLYSDLDYLLAGDSWAGVGVAEFLFAPIKFTLVQKSWTVTRLFVPRSILSLLGVWRTEILGKTKSSLVKLVALKVLRFLTLRSCVNGKKQNETSLKFPLKKRKLQVWVVSRSKTEIFEFFFFCWSFGVRAWKLAEKETRKSRRKRRRNANADAAAAKRLRQGKAAQDQIQRRIAEQFAGQWWLVKKAKF